MDLQQKKYLEKKFIERFLFHMRNVQDNMLNLENNRDKLPFRIGKSRLICRSMKHDIDKFSANMVNDYFMLFSKNIINVLTMSITNWSSYLIDITKPKGIIFIEMA